MKLYSILTIVAMATALTCCSANKKTKANKGEQEIVQLCSYSTDETTFYGNGVAESTDMQMAKDKATTSARAEISATLNIAVENFVKRYRTDTNDTLDQKTEDRLQTLTIQTLANSTVCCERVVRAENGKYRAYVSVALPKTVVADAAKRAMAEQKEATLDDRASAFDKIVEQEIVKAGK